MSSLYHIKAKQKSAIPKPEGFLKAAMQTQKMAWWTLDLESNQLSYHPNRAKMLGYELHEYPKTMEAIFAMIHPEDRANCKQALSDHLEGKAPNLHLEYRMQSKMGEELWLLDNGCITEWNEYGKPTVMSGVVTDITISKSAQLVLEERERELVRMLSDQDHLFSLIAHDLKNSVVNLDQLLGLITEEQETHISWVREKLHLAKKTSALLSTQLNDMISWKIAQNEVLKPSKQNLSIHKIFDLVSEQFKPLLSEKHLHIELFMEEDFLIYTDLQMLQSVLRNLIGNAIKYSHPHSSIILKAESSSSQKIKISVVDHGTGIRPKRLKQIQDGQYSESTKGTLGEEGSGFGILLCVQLLKKLETKLVIQSKWEKGSIFSFKLPRA